MGRRGRRRNRSSTYIVAFGLGLLACLILPARFMVFLLLVALLFCALSCG